MTKIRWQVNEDYIGKVNHIRKFYNSSDHASFFKICLIKKFVILYLITPLQREVEFNRGTVHYVHHGYICFGFLNSQKNVLSGYALIDFFSRIMLCATIWICVIINFSAYYDGFFYSLLFYLVHLLISTVNGQQTLDLIEALWK